MMNFPKIICHETLFQIDTKGSKIRLFDNLDESIDQRTNYKGYKDQLLIDEPIPVIAKKNIDDIAEAITPAVDKIIAAIIEYKEKFGSFVFLEPAPVQVKNYCTSRYKNKILSVLMYFDNRSGEEKASIRMIIASPIRTSLDEKIT